MSWDRILVKELRFAAQRKGTQTAAQQHADRIAQRLRDLADKVEYDAWVGDRDVGPRDHQKSPH